MVMTDPIADLISRIKTAILRKREVIDMPASKLRVAIARLLKEEGFIANCEELTKGKKKFLRIRLKYGRDEYGKIKFCAVNNMKRISKPGCRVYKPADEIHRLFGGFGTIIVSTSKGLKTDDQTRHEKLGGELLLKVW